ncbi:MAG TPA: patatin-like phospholipase family protein, partial [Nitrososphaeraceae archaeon]|nr:patatin-like phospholipase family protein [Nitrososphaeraceae archaeon]
KIPKEERALVLQGGGSLGAYEAGAYKALNEWLIEKDKRDGKETSVTFDIVAGTSIGAMNATVLTSYVIEKGTYEGSADRLLDFWAYLSKESRVDADPWFKRYWDYLHTMDKKVATGEAARRYYSAKQFAMTGVPHVFSPLTPAPDSRFFDFMNNTWYRFSNTPLKESLERFAKFPIASSQEDNQPRLLLVTADVADGIPVTFDSYPKEDGTRYTEYGKYVKQDGKDVGFEHVIRYNDGITSDHVMASGCFPINFDYSKLEVESYYSNPIDKNSSNNFPQMGENGGGVGNNFGAQYRKEIRYFWDGGILTNTPLTQLVILHRQYWYKIRGLKDKTPSLTVAVINVHPTTQKHIPTDHDGAVDRKNDISFSDRSHKDEEVLLLISDYVDLVKELIKVAKEAGAKDDVITNLMNQRTRYHGLTMRPRLYKEIVEGRFDIKEIVRLERTNDENTISDKTFDFSAGTITQLIKDGFEDAENVITTRNLGRVKREYLQKPQ